MLNWIFESEEYTSLYHQYFEEFLNSVDIQGIIDNAYNLIKSYVEKDPTAFIPMRSLKQVSKPSDSFAVCAAKVFPCSLRMEKPLKI